MAYGAFMFTETFVFFFCNRFTLKITETLFPWGQCNEIAAINELSFFLIIGFVLVNGFDLYSTLLTFFILSFKFSTQLYI